MVRVAEMIVHFTLQGSLEDRCKNLFDNILDFLSTLRLVSFHNLFCYIFSWGRCHFTFCHLISILLIVYPRMGHKINQRNYFLHKLFYTPLIYNAKNSKDLINIFVFIISITQTSQTLTMSLYP